MTAHCLCSRPRSGLVTSRPLGGIEDSYAAAPVCSDADCILEAKAWVLRVSLKTGHYVADEVSVS